MSDTEKTYELHLDQDRLRPLLEGLDAAAADGQAYLVDKPAAEWLCTILSWATDVLAGENCTCACCGAPSLRRGPEMAEHMRTCEKHPLSGLLAAAEKALPIVESVADKEHFDCGPDGECRVIDARDQLRAAIDKARPRPGDGGAK